MITRLDDKRLCPVVRRCVDCGVSIRCNARGGVQTEMCADCRREAAWRYVVVRSIKAVPRLHAYLLIGDDKGFHRANRAVQEIAAILRDSLADNLPRLCHLPIALTDEQIHNFEKILSSLTLSRRP